MTEGVIPVFSSTNFEALRDSDTMSVPVVIIAIYSPDLSSTALPISKE